MIVTTDTKSLKAAIDQIRPLLKEGNFNYPPVNMYFVPRFAFFEVGGTFHYERIGYHPKYLKGMKFETEGNVATFKVGLRCSELNDLTIPAGKKRNVRIEVRKDMAGDWKDVIFTIDGAMKSLDVINMDGDNQIATYYNPEKNCKDGKPRLFHVKGKDFLNGLMVTKHSMAGRNEMREYLQGVYIEEDSPDCLYMTSTDGHRLTRFSTTKPWDDYRDQMEGVILHRKDAIHLATLLKPFANTEEIIAVVYDTEILRFCSQSPSLEFDFHVRPIHKRYPDYKRVMLDRSPEPLSINKESLINALNAVKLKKKGGKDADLILRSNDDLDAIEIKNSHDLTKEDKMSCARVFAENVSHLGGEKMYNHRYFSEAVSICKGDVVTLSFKEDTVRIEGNGDTNVESYAMRLRTA